jgi:hypothetical protein
VCFAAPVSKITPLILAAKHGRSDVMKKLISVGADTSARDHHDSSALFYASRLGDLESVKTLLKSKYKQNDGSLHEAARNLHSNVVAELIGGKHDANFPSSGPEHNGRTALQELPYRCKGVNRVNDIDDTIRALQDGKADGLKKWQNKTSLFLALDNEYPLEVTRALLDTIMWQHMDNPDNVFACVDPDSGITYFRSANIYLKDFKDESKQGWQLMQLLQTKGCVTRYYAEYGAMQPLDAVGFPEEIAKEQKRRLTEAEKRRTSEADHREKLRRMQEEAELKLMMDQSKHEVQQSHEYEKAMQKVGSSTIVHNNEMRQKVQMNAQNQQALAERSVVREQSKIRIATTNQTALEREQQLKLSYAQQSANQNITLQKAQNDLTKQAPMQKMASQKAQNDLSKQAAKQKFTLQ